MEFRDIFNKYQRVLLYSDGILKSEDGVSLIKVSKMVYESLISRIGSTAKLADIVLNISESNSQKGTLILSKSLDLTELINEHGYIEIDVNTRDIKTQTKISVGQAPEDLITALRNSNEGKVMIKGATMFISKDHNKLIVRNSQTDLQSIDDIIQFGIKNNVSNITLTPEGSRYRVGGKCIPFGKVYGDKELLTIISKYDSGIANSLEKHPYTTTKMVNNTAVNIFIVKDTKFTLIFDFIKNKERKITDYFDAEWIQFVRSRNKSEFGGIVIVSEKQDLPDVIPNFINTITSPEDIVLTYSKSIPEINAQYLEFTRSVPLEALTSVNTDVVVLDFATAMQDWDSVFSMSDNGSLVVLTVNESSIYTTLNMITETFEKQYQYRKFIDSLLGINVIWVAYNDETTEMEIKYDYIYNNKQFQILLGSKTYNKSELQDKKYKHYYFTLGGVTKSVDEFILDILKHANEVKAHNIDLSVGSPPAFRVGRDIKCNYITDKLQPYMTESIFLEIVKDPLLQEQFKKDPGKGLPISYSVPGVGRYRVNVYSQRSSISLSLRKIPSKIPTMDWCGIPKSLQKVLKRATAGLVLVTGPTGSGKSTTLASIIESYNESKEIKIITTEDPIEFLFESKTSVIEQIEIGQDSQSYLDSLKSNMRNNPDVLLVGEIRDAEVLSVALNAATTGHLVLATLHTTGAKETIQRVIDMTPTGNRENMKSLLAENLLCTITQKLLPSTDGGMVAAHEVMLMNQAIKSAIVKESSKALGDIPNILQGGRNEGMQDMNYAIACLVVKGKVSLEIAKKYAPSPEAVTRYVSAVS